MQEAERRVEDLKREIARLDTQRESKLQRVRRTRHDRDDSLTATTPVVQSRLGNITPGGLETLADSFHIPNQARRSLVDGGSYDRETIEDILGGGEDVQPRLAAIHVDEDHKQSSAEGEDEENQEDEEEEQLVSAFELFKGPKPPMPFKPRRKCQLDATLDMTLKSMHFMLPVECIREGLFLLGPNRVNIDYKYGQLLVKKGGGAERLEDYLDRNYDTME